MHDRLAAIEHIVAQHRHEHGALLSILEEVQRTSEHNYLSKDALAQVARNLELPLADVYSVAT
ncbi:MAG: NAD(P)H-dependent oxidoreductase subunit E, partial [Spirochaetia bacterium]|nr:NAD(P)H-dependent oxidoreductase subunit E [Spirochaetia bacterium]